MQNKLDPRQYTPYALNTPSGNLSFVEGVDFFNCYLLNDLSGSFNISGNLTVNGSPVSVPSSTNGFGGTNVSIFNSLNAFATGSSNSVLGSDSSEISGNNNIIVGGRGHQILLGSDSSIIGGRNGLMGHTGAMLLGDGDNSRQKDSVQHQSLTIDFSSGAFIQNSTYINGSFYVTGGRTVLQDFYLPNTASGLISGNLNVLGTSYHTGSPLQNLQNLRDASGSLLTLSTGISGVLRRSDTGISGAFDVKLLNTGAALRSYVATVSGILSADYDLEFTTTVRTTGNQTVAGRKFFSEGVFFNFVSGKDIQSTGRFIVGSGRAIPTAYNSAGVSGQISWTPSFLYICTGNNAWGKIAITNF